MTVRYSRMIAAGFALLCGVSLVLAVALVLLGAEGSTLLPLGVTVVVTLVPAITLRNKVYFHVGEEDVRLNALIGPASSSHPMDAPGAVRLSDGRLEVRRDGEWKRIWVFRFMSRKEDWRALQERLAA